MKSKTGYAEADKSVQSAIDRINKLNQRKGTSMTQDEIIEMAKRAGFEEHQAKFDTRFETFAKLVDLRYQKKIADLENIICQRHWDVLQEREACALICDEHADDPVYCGEAIRARGERA